MDGGIRAYQLGKNLAYPNKIISGCSLFNVYIQHKFGAVLYLYPRFSWNRHEKEMIKSRQLDLKCCKTEGLSSHRNIFELEFLFWLDKSKCDKNMVDRLLSRCFYN